MPAQGERLMFIGIDLGASGVKIVLLDRDGMLRRGRHAYDEQRRWPVFRELYARLKGPRRSNDINEHGK